MKIYKIFLSLIILFIYNYNAFSIDINGNNTININTNTTLNALESSILTEGTTNIINEINSKHSTKFAQFNYPQILDLTTIDSTLIGYVGAVTDGNYVYMFPNYSATSINGKLVRISCNDFTTNGVTILDLKTINTNYYGFFGICTDGKYIYSTLNYNYANQGLLIRVDLNDFTTNGVTTIDLTTINTNYKGFAGTFYNNSKVYFIPRSRATSTPIGSFIRVDITNFTTSGVTVLELTNFEENCKGYVSGCVYNNYAYLNPNENNYAKFIRIDLNDFTTNGVTTLDQTSVDITYKGYYGSFIDGRCIYYVPNYNGSAYHGKILRVDIDDWTTNTLKILDLATVDADCRGYGSGISINGYAYFIPNNNTVRFGKVARVDLNDFTTNGVTIMDISKIDASLKGYIGSCYRYPYLYLTPYRNTSAYHGKLAGILVDYGGNF